MPRCGLVIVLAAAALSAQPALPFRTQEIATGLGVVYAVAPGDVDGDGQLDIIAINNTQLLWFRNPGWTRHVIAEKITKADNVALAPMDIDGDGKLDFALGADWQPTNTVSGGSLHWVDSAGTVHNIAAEPTLHRIGWADLDGDRRPELVVVPLHGRGAQATDWTAGNGARILVFRIPPNPRTDPWPVEVVDDSLHIVHNFTIIDREIWAASAEGVFSFRRDAQGRWRKRQAGEGKPGEIRMGRSKSGRLLATVEPWHGNTLVLYEEAAGLWKRSEIDTGLHQGHALGWADFDADGADELVAGWRGKPWGLAYYRITDGRWQRTILDSEIAVEDLTIADLNGDGRPDVVAGGRATGNLRIYWNTSQ